MSHSCAPEASWLNRLLYWIASTAFRLTGWSVDAKLLDLPKWVLVVAPHTSYWDGIIIIMAEAIITCGFYTVRVSWLGKHTLFRGPLRRFMKAVGGIPVDRRARHALVEQVVQAFRLADRLVIAVTPEGMRNRTKYWKTGFYYIALGAGVPILLAAVDYRRKLVVTGPSLMPSGDIEADLAKMREFFCQVTAKHPERVGEIAVPPRE
jgi:1-acyl-sn-glycerol-3-phosphate acyltransferase